MGFWTKDDTDTHKAKISEIDKEIAKLKEQKEEWIWVEGYKGTDENMKCRDFQFELNIEYVHDGEVKECASGFHMCKQLHHVFNYYPWGNSMRYFKVKALVRKADDAKYGSRVDDNPYSYLMSSGGRVDKLAAKKIILVEEITWSEDVYETVKENHAMLESYDEFKTVSDFCKFKREKFEVGLTKHHTPILTAILFDDISKMKDGEEKLYRTLKLSETLHQEGVNTDMSVYLLLNSIK